MDGCYRIIDLILHHSNFLPCLPLFFFFYLSTFVPIHSSQTLIWYQSIEWLPCIFFFQFNFHFIQFLNLRICYQHHTNYVSRAHSLHATLTLEDYLRGHKLAPLDLIEGRETFLRYIKTFRTRRVCNILKGPRKDLTCLKGSRDVWKSLE